MKNVISQSLGLDLVNINVYAKVYQNIPLSSRDRAVFTFSEFEPRQRLGHSQMTFDNPLGYILSISMNMQNFIKLYQTVKELSTFFTNWPGTKSSQTVQGQNLHKLSGDKIKCLIIGHSMKFNFKFLLTFLGSCNKRNKDFLRKYFKRKVTKHASIHRSHLLASVGQRQKFITIILIYNLRQLFHMCSPNRSAVYH